ncbi:MAG: ABC transporter ATP-binding protein [Alphaproteobacteria bacterium]|nr:ABC transporter ATP-binding protein [Alphaproteobacteria bacterium]
MTKDISTKQVFSFIYKTVRPFLWGIFVMVFVAVMWAIILSVRSYTLKILLNRVTDDTTPDLFAYLMGPALVYLLISFLYPTIFRIHGYFVGIKMIPQLRRKIGESTYELLLKQSHSYYQHQFSGSLANKINDLVAGIPSILESIIDRFLGSGLALAIAIFTLWQVNIKFGLIMLIWAVLFMGGAFFLSKRIVELSDKWSEWGSTNTGKVVDALSNILSIRLFARETAETHFLQTTLGAAVKAEQKLEWSYFWLWFSYGYSFFLVLSLNLYFLIKGRAEGWITVGDFALVLTLNIAIVDFFWRLTQEFSQFSKSLGKIKQALRTIMVTPEIQDKANALSLVVSKGEIVFDHVQFQYKGSEPLFYNKSVRIKSGQKVGLVGYSGSGKTTFVNLILRLYDVTSGHILIDDQDIQNITQNSLHEAIGMIPQDPTLFHRSLLENIRYGRLSANDAEVIEAAKRAHTHEFITQLPQAYDSLVGERGVKLSGGQRQRIAIARVILKNAPILILDEATSQLDSVTESFIQESLWDVMQDKTTIVIAHRLSTLLHMDRILVFDRGKIVEDGTHQELLGKGGLYKTLWDAQVGGFLPDDVPGLIIR